MNICLLGLSGSGKTCYLYTMSHVLANGISINGHTISAISTDRRQQLRLNRGIEQMANGIWPDGSTDTITYSFDLKVDGCSMGEFTIYDYRGGALDGMSDNDMDDAEELFDTFEDSSCITFLIDGDTLLAALDPQYLEPEHSNISFQSQLKARHKINYIESLIKECSQRLDNNVPILLVITKKDIFSDNELTAGQELLRNLLPTVFSKHNDMTVGITSVTLGRNLNNDHGKITNRQVTLYLNTKGNIHLPVLFALLQDLDDDINVPIDVEEIRSLTYKLFTPDRISFYRGGRKSRNFIKHMKIEFYSYTRGEQPDYRDFCLPNNIGKDFISVLQNMVRPILECDLDNPRWVLYKKHNVVAWGLCCKNETLSNSCNVDIKGRSVKGFFALIFSDIEEDNFWIPSFDINIFKNFYEEEIAPYWYCQEGDIHYSHKHSVDGIHIDKIFAKNNEYSEELNSNIFQCKSLGRMDKKEVIAAAMTFPEISLLIDNEDFVEATGKKSPFMNCLSSNVSSKTVKVKRICPQCHKYVDEFTENGICVKCDNDNNINITTNDIDIMNQHDISLQDKENLEKLKKTLRDSELSVKELENKLKKEKLANKILLAICSVFLLIIAYLWHNKTGEGSVSDNKEVVKDSTVISKEKTYRLEVYPKTIEAQSTGRDSIVITWKDNAPKVKATFADKNDWVKEVSKNDNSIVVRVEKNETGKEREAIVEFVLDGQKEKVNIKQAAH